MPSYDGDAEAAEGLPAGALALRDRLERCDAFAIASPEYNASLPGVLKNAIDWVSRVRPQPFKDQARAAALRLPVHGRRQPRAVDAADPPGTPRHARLSGHVQPRRGPPGFHGRRTARRHRPPAASRRHRHRLPPASSRPTCDTYACSAGGTSSSATGPRRPSPNGRRTSTATVLAVTVGQFPVVCGRVVCSG